jgi:hypothetical protein
MPASDQKWSSTRAIESVLDTLPKDDSDEPRFEGPTSRRP